MWKSAIDPFGPAQCVPQGLLGRQAAQDARRAYSALPPQRSWCHTELIVWHSALPNLRISIEHWQLERGNPDLPSCEPLEDDASLGADFEVLDCVRVGSSGRGAAKIAFCGAPRSAQRGDRVIGTFRKSSGIEARLHVGGIFEILSNFI